MDGVVHKPFCLGLISFVLHSAHAAAQTSGDQQTVRPPQRSYYGLAPRKFWTCRFTLSVKHSSQRLLLLLLALLLRLLLQRERARLEQGLRARIVLGGSQSRFSACRGPTDFSDSAMDLRIHSEREEEENTAWCASKL